jgi:hypothetical protein
LFALAVIVNAGVNTATVDEHPAPPPPGGHELPTSADATTLESTLSPGSGSFTVTEYVNDADPPTARSPVHVNVDPVKPTNPVPEVTATSPLYVASSTRPAIEFVTTAPV